MPRPPGLAVPSALDTPVRERSVPTRQSRLPPRDETPLILGRLRDTAGRHAPYHLCDIPRKQGRAKYLAPRGSVAERRDLWDRASVLVDDLASRRPARMLALVGSGRHALGAWIARGDEETAGDQLLARLDEYGLGAARRYGIDASVNGGSGSA